MKENNKTRKASAWRHAVQLGFALFLNGYAAGFAKGRIFAGRTKAFCVPVLNCYSCPGALGACPIGSMQAVLGKTKSKFPAYVLGTIMLFGVLCGRLLCGFVCPFGFIQDLIHKIPGKKLKIPKKADRVLRLLKYLILIVFVIILPAFAPDSNGISQPWFCKYICPAGTLEGGIPLTAANEQLRSLLGPLFTWKAALLAVILIASVFINRFFCRYICPLGAFYSLFNRFSFYRLDIDREKCVDCKKCEQVCPMAVDVTKNINSAECIRCGKCKHCCPESAITSSFGVLTALKKNEEMPKSESPDKE